MVTTTLLMSKSSPKVQLVPEHSRSAQVGNTSSTAISFFILTTIVGEEVVLAGFSSPLREVRN